MIRGLNRYGRAAWWAVVWRNGLLRWRYGGVVTAWGWIDPGALSIAALVRALIQAMSAP